MDAASLLAESLLARWVKDALYRVATSVPAPANSASILVYHSVSEARHFGTVTPRNFERQMAALARLGFSVVSLDTLATMRRKRRIPPKTVCLTFDDGYRDTHTTVLPILKKYAFPATVFVATGVIGKRWERRGEAFEMLSEEEVRELVSSGLVAVAPHTVSHPKLPYLAREEAEAEIVESKRRIESLTGKECRHFAYPFGRHDEKTRETLKRAGLHFAYTTTEGLVRPDDDDFALHRSGINRTVTLPQFLGTALHGRLSRARLARTFGL